MRSRIVLPLLLGLAAALPVAASTLPCRPCVGLRVDDPLSLLAALVDTPPLAADARLLIAHEVALDRTASPAFARASAARGALPWLTVVFDSPAPIAEQATELQDELAALSELARATGAGAHFQVAWRPRLGEKSIEQYAFLLKRASVAIAGAAPDAWVVTEPLAGEEGELRRLYAEQVGAYLEAVALAPASPDRLRAALGLLAELDPGRPIAIDALPAPAPPERALVEAARFAALGADLVLFRAPAASAEALAPLRVLANEFRGDLSYDAASSPQGAEAWAFVRGEDLGLRVIAAAPDGSDELALRFADDQLRSPERVDPATGEALRLGAVSRGADGLRLRVADPGAAVLLRLERVTAAELLGVAERVTVAGERELPVEEILRRLQASEDAQARRLRHFQATNTTSLRFQLGSGVQSVDATFQGEFFFRQGQGFDWAWQQLYINGVRWRGKSLPQIPIIQPEKAAAMPLEILLTKEYSYRLRGRDEVNGRPCWVVEFEPAAAAEPGRTLYRGTVWIDRDLAVRVRSRTLQLGLTGEVLSNEETLDYAPIGESGDAVAWSREAFVLPLTLRGQQIFSLVNSATVVDRETRYTDLRVNGPEFDERRQQVMASEATMVRDTAQGLRYLVKDETTGERKVKEGFDTHKLFGLAGLFYDDSLDFPLPLAGINYFDLDFRGGRRQLNAFFGGVLGIVNFADPSFLGSRWDLGADLFLFAYPLTDRLYREGDEVPAEDVRELPARITVNLGHPLGSFGKIDLSYRLAYSNYRDAEDTAREFVVPSDHFEHRLASRIQFARAGYRLQLEGALHRRSRWEPWGLPGSGDYDPDAREYLTWEGAFAKNWYLPKFQKVGLELNYAGGDDLDRFSKYSFGFFGGNRVHGYQIGKVRAEEAYAAHLTYGFEIGELLRLDAVLDGAWATDEASGLEREFLAGVGLAGTLMGPWETLVNLDLGYALAGPDSGISVYVVFLKFFK